MQVPGGILSMKFGGKPIFGLGILGASLFTILLPFVIFNFPLIITCRIVTGFFEAVSYPTVHHLISQWIPEKERSRAIGFIWSGAYMGTIFSNLISPQIVNWMGWHAIFYISGASGILWSIFFYFFTSSSPKENRFITQHELLVIEKGITKSKSENNPIPWKDLFSKFPIWALIINNFSSNWGFYVLLMWLPTYMKDELHYNLDDSGVLSFLPYVALFFLSIISGRFADVLLNAGINRTLVRKVFQTLGTLLPSLFLSLLCMKPESYIAVCYMIFAIACSGFSTPGAGVNSLDVAPHYAGVLLGITNTAATIPGIIGVAATGFILDITHSWCYVFLLATTIYVFGCFVFLVFATGKRVI